ncbi:MULTISPECIES: hypothetical protein [unclassified Bradyrhizobium]|uniref:hypothetical protein n=1 Tax=unclassified Bradyrhizobium TaxID=2631580 RepID=UPI0028E5FC5C|nr:MULTISPECIES: hypothetical protein [unclassified Bradyrhizobium]
MSTAELHIVYEPDEDGTGKMIATARAGAFAATGAAWFGRDLDTFLEGLRSYPLSSDAPPMIEGGFFKSRSAGFFKTYNECELEQCHLRITIKPYDLRGSLLVHVELASEVWKTPDADLQKSASIRFLTEYAMIDRFATELGEVLKGRRDVAILSGTTN